MIEQNSARLADRYGRTPRRGTPSRRRRVIWGAVGVVAAIIGVAAFTFGTSIGSDLSVVTAGYTVDSPREVSVRWQISGAADEALICTIAAQSVDSAVVGIRSIVVGAAASGGDRTGVTTVRTMRAAASGLISNCRRA